MPTIQIEVSEKRMADMLCNAFEGGSNYWIEHVKILKGKFDVDPWNENFRYPQYCAPFCTEGALHIKHEDGTHVLNKGRLLEGARIMAEKFPQHFADLMSENDDATTGDVFLQCCLFEDCVYG